MINHRVQKYIEDHEYKLSDDATVVFDSHDRIVSEASDGKVHLSPFEGLLLELSNGGNMPWSEGFFCL